LLFILCNCKHINEAINCVKLAAQVLAENCSLIFQPIWNVPIKILLLLGFMALIGVSLSSSTISPSTVSFTMPWTNNGAAATKQVTIGGVARSFDML